MLQGIGELCGGGGGGVASITWTCCETCSETMPDLHIVLCLHPEHSTLNPKPRDVGDMLDSPLLVPGMKALPKP